MIALLALLLAQAEEGPWKKYEPPHENVFDQFDPKEEKLSPGPHTLVISDRDGMTRIDYPSGAKCQHARDVTRRQVAPPPNSNGIIYAPSTVKAFCVPR
ncbi:hypothetical protein VH570_06385 [Sphingobium sp. HT1-2]|jgi:hypothetical protein|uniref:hypothetical protein n=1 Tax=Sphingobium TaxID=165695 RepID=UPI000F7EEC54